MPIRSTATAPQARGLLLLGLLVLLAWAGAAHATDAAPKKLKVFILAGQSNMEGYAQIKTFDSIGDDPATAPLLKTMRGADGKPTVCGHTWISYLTGLGDKDFVLDGPMTAGYGSMWGVDPTKPGDKIGPEFTFGLTMDAAIKEPVLVIKTAWGGKSLNTEFRPPSAGPYKLPQATKDLWAQYPNGAHNIPKEEERKAWWDEKKKTTGVNYRMMIEHVKKVLADPKRVCPEYDAKEGYEIAGFVWFQGWNDLVDGLTYPDRHDKPEGYALYTDLLSTFIRDVRKDLKAPGMPFVIGVLGVEGLHTQRPAIITFRKAMAAPAALPEFHGSVVAVETAPFWAEELAAIDEKRQKVGDMRYHLDIKHKDYPNADGHMTTEQKDEYIKKYEADLISPADAATWNRGASHAGYHYYGCAKTFAQMGKAFAEALLPFQK
jgi:alpha-galactosidase